MSTTIRTTGLATVCSHVASSCLPASRRGALDEDHQINVGFNGLKKLDEEGHETFQTVAREVAKVRGTSRPFLDLAYCGSGEREDD